MRLPQIHCVVCKPNADFVHVICCRWRFASLWLNEEWYNDYQGTSNERPTSRNYRSLLFLLLQQPSFLASPSLPAFLLSLPDLPHEALQVLQSLCEHSDRALARIGMRTLRELVVERPPVRELALGQLLELCTHPGLSFFLAFVVEDDV